MLKIDFRFNFSFIDCFFRNILDRPFLYVESGLKFFGMYKLNSVWASCQDTVTHSSAGGGDPSKYTRPSQTENYRNKAGHSRIL
jgi:hypothetical protein